MTITSITGVVVVVGSGRFTATLPSGEVFEGAVGSDILETLHTTTSDNAPTCVSETTVESLTPMGTTETSTPELEAVISVAAEPLDHTSESEITVAGTAGLTEPGVEALAPMAPIETATPDLNSTPEIEVIASSPSASVSIPVDGSVSLLSSFLAFSSVQTPHETALKPLETDLSTLDIPHGSQILTLPGGLKLVVLPGRYLIIDLDGTLHEFDLDGATGPVTDHDAHSTADTGLTMTVTSIAGAVVVVGSGLFTATLPSGEMFEGMVGVGSEALEALPTFPPRPVHDVHFGTETVSSDAGMEDLSETTPLESSDSSATAPEDESDSSDLKFVEAKPELSKLKPSWTERITNLFKTTTTAAPTPGSSVGPVTETPSDADQAAFESCDDAESCDDGEKVDEGSTLNVTPFEIFTTEQCRSPVHADDVPVHADVPVLVEDVPVLVEADLSTLDIPHGAHILTLPGGLKLVVLPGRYLVVDLDGTLYEFDLDSATGPVTEYDAVHTTDTDLTMTVTSITGVVVVVGSGRFTATLPS
ncbi:MAG: uncharacterized protein KVP18_003889, partial [Porospora cf. gigantea A]